MEARLQSQLPQITKRQLEVARLVAQGLDNPAIAEELGVSLAGAKYHVSELLSRLNLTTREEIATWYNTRDNRGLLHRYAFAPVGLAITATAGAVAVGAAVIAISFGSAGGPSDAPVTPAAATEAATEVAVAAITGDGAFLPVPTPQSAPRLYHGATTLDDGRVLLAGGGGSAQNAPAEIYDPAAGTFEPAGSLLTPRTNHATVLLNNGRVLLTGGVNRGPPILKSTEIWDPTTSEFTLAGSMNVRRMAHAAVTLADGRVLISGGGFIEINDEGRLPDPIDTAEIYDPATDSFIPISPMNVARRDHHLTLLEDGRVLVSGGGPLEIYDPATEQFSLFGGEPVFGSEATVATMLADGRILITGVYADPGDREIGASQNARGAYIVEPASGAIVPVGQTRTGRERFHTGTLLPDGRVLIAGGVGGYGTGDGVIRYPPSEIFDPVTGTFEPTSHTDDSAVPGGLRATNMAAHRPGHTANPLPDGTVLLIGYFADENFTWTVERFDPLAAAAEDPFGDFIVAMESKPPRPPGDVVDASSPPMFAGNGDPFGFDHLAQATAERGLQLRSLPVGIGFCIEGAAGLSGQGLRVERTDGTAAVDFFFIVYSSSDGLLKNWIVDEVGRVAPRPETDCDESFGGGARFPSSTDVVANENLLLLLRSVSPDYRESNPETRALLIEAFEAIGTTEE